MYELLGLFLAVLSCSHALEDCASAEATPSLRKLEQIPQHDYGRPGLSHMTVWGAKHHGMKELEVWLQTFAPGSGTPIHRHDCEEVFIVQAGEAAYFQAGPEASDGSELPVESTANTNSTFWVPPNAVHQVRNLHPTEDLRVLVIVSKPPVRVYVYETWDTPHSVAVLSFPYPWDRVCPDDLVEKGEPNDREL